MGMEVINCRNTVLNIWFRFWMDFQKKNKNSEKYIDDQDELISDALKFTYNKLDNDFYQNVYQ